MNKIVNTNRLLGCDASKISINVPFMHKGAKYNVVEVTKDENLLIAKVYNFDLDYSFKAYVDIGLQKVVNTVRTDL